MEEKINIAELLKDCPKGMELDCIMYDNVTLESVSIECDYAIRINTRSGFSTRLTKYGQNVRNEDAKCVIFPKGKTTWEGFVPPCQFKDGDIIATDLGSVCFLNTSLNTDECYGCYVGIGGDGSFHICEPFAYKECCGLATEEEKKKLLQAIKSHGYKWNAENKTLETLVTNKFDITTLKPFDKVLVKHYNATDWKADIYSHYDEGMTNSSFCCIGAWYEMCIPYEGNEHLLGTSDECDEYYKNWK